MSHPDPERNSCPACKSGLLEFISGTFGSGVFHPDGTEERLHEEFYQCDRCSQTFDEADLDELVRGLADRFPSEGHYTL